MYPNVPTILRSDELLDKALGRAAKIVKSDRVAAYRIRKTTLAQLQSIEDTLVETLERYVAGLPNLSKVSSYERELIDIVVGVDRLRNALGRISGACEVIRQVVQENARLAGRTLDTRTIRGAKRAAIGRVSSIVGDLASSLRFLGQARDVLRAIPDVTPGDPTIVIAGYPNVGTSSLLARLSSGRPEIAPYPYTTKSANVGHFPWPPTGPSHRRRRHQLIDTPGLLEKPAAKRNAIERQAVLALRYLADVVVFVLDPSEACGYDLAAQEKLLAQVRTEFPGAPIVEVENKADLKATGSGRLAVSCETGSGLPELKRLLVEAVPADKYQEVFSEELPRS